jgi:hypothetical protein
LDGRFTFVGDALYVPNESMLEIIYGFERLLLTAASHDISATQLSAVAGVRPVRRGAEWVSCRDGYVDLAATRDLWRHVAGTDLAGVFAEPVGGPFHRLVGYSCSPDGDRSVTQMHRAFMSFLGESTSIRAPDWYVLCREAPATAADRAGWSGLRVAEEGTGR